MSNKIKIKKHKEKEETKEKVIRDSKHGTSFMKSKREKGTITSNFSGKSSKEFSRKKT